VLVAVGAVAVVAAGLAVVFDSVGKTLSAGRRNSRVNQVATLLQQQLATDFASMSREGFLVIRQSYADVDASGDFSALLDRVSMSPAESEANARPRRVDEILFFQAGSFSTQRTPLVPGGDTELARLASAGEAMLYYGHGNKWSGQLDEVRLNVESEDDGDNVNRLGGVDGANPDAASWVLVRRQVLLAGDGSTDNAELGSYFDIGVGDPELPDGDCQVLGMPAAASIFRAMNRAYGPLGQALPGGPQREDYAWFLPGDTNFVRTLGGGARAGVVLASGAVDIATTSLREVRGIIENFSSPPAASVLISGGVVEPAQANQVIDPTGNNPIMPDPLGQMRAWMDNAFPTASPDPVLIAALPGEEETYQARIRVATQPPALLANLRRDVTSTVNQRIASVSRSDRQAVASGALLTNCTEFVVEWTFGKTDTNGELVWHGPPRRGATVAPYPAGVGGAYEQLASQATVNGRLVVSSPLQPLVVYGEVVPDVGLAAWQRSTLTSTFGFRDPTFDPNLDPTTPTWSDPQDLPDLMPWPWPTQIRVRVSVTDPLDPTSENEQTFEYVFAVPTERSAS
jgi:hypothetical protein